MAEAIAQKIIAENKDNMGDILVTSAGTQAMDGMQAADYAVQIGREVGINLAEFRSKSLNPELIAEADIILTMTNRHKQQIINLAPEAKNKVFLLKEYISDLAEKEDHYQKAEEIYHKIQEKQQRFFAKHGAVLEELEERKKQLEKELDEVITEIGRWEAKLYQETLPERVQLGKLEKEIQGLEISDPFGQPLEVYRQCFQELYDAINKALNKIIKNDC